MPDKQRLHLILCVGFSLLGLGFALDLGYAEYNGRKFQWRSAIEMLGCFLLAWYFLRLRKG
ncbi:hypothetical protein [Pseudomarimonas arenosa]|uniref:Uncharacterized protein n=1 Tax=Pseudomarimonas arenosa TaxID=2774145 RepID=A0AAW3ZMP4_9GAMM|nr:hypothetical protein [Pseudomarimonas arenosa]MBD8527418.1 hypothetical protein [Pseudomarimonas arenosa]